MKLFILLLLMLPGLSWGEEITLVCNYKNLIVKPEGKEWIVASIPKNEEVFIFDSNNKTFTWVEGKSKKFKLTRETDKFYDFSLPTENQYEHYEDIGLNRYTLDVAIVVHKKFGLSKTASLICTKQERLL